MVRLLAAVALLSAAAAAGLAEPACEAGSACGRDEVDDGALIHLRSGARRDVPWKRLFGTNCYTNRGAEPVNPSEQWIEADSVENCKRMCFFDPNCEAVVTCDHSCGDPRFKEGRTCWTIKKVTLSQCETNTGFTTHLKPKPKPLLVENWGVTGRLSGVNCYPGRGAEAVDPAKQFLDVAGLEACQAACDQKPGCEAVVMCTAENKWCGDARFKVGQTCWLIKNVDQKACQKDDAAYTTWLRKWNGCSSSACYNYDVMYEGVGNYGYAKFYWRCGSNFCERDCSVCYEQLDVN